MTSLSAERGSAGRSGALGGHSPGRCRRPRRTVRLCRPGVSARPHPAAAAPRPPGRKAASHRGPPEPAPRSARPLGAPEPRCLLRPAATAAAGAPQPLLARLRLQPPRTARSSPAAAPARPSQAPEPKCRARPPREAGTEAAPGLSAAPAGPARPEGLVLLWAPHVPHGLSRVLSHKNLDRNHFQYYYCYFFS